jgi:hypothetical protein
MTKQLRRGACMAGAILVAASASALAAHPLKGRVYAGVTAHGKASVTLTISKSGTTLTASVPRAPLYCQGGGPSPTQVTKPAAIAANGSFSGAIVYFYQGQLSYKVRFSGRVTKANLITGTVRSEYKSRECSGSTTFSATPALAR